MRFILLLVLTLMAMAGQSLACSPPRLDDKSTPLEIAQETLKSSDGRFIGKVEVSNFEAVDAGQAGDFEITYKVLKQYAGAPVSQITVIARSNTCQVFKPYVGQTDLINVGISGKNGEYPQMHGGFPMISNDDLEAALDELTAGNKQ